MNKSCGIVVPTLGTRNSLIESLKSIRLSSRAHICLVAPESFEVFDLFDMKLIDQLVPDPGTGLAAAINRGIQEMPRSVKYVNWLGDDDVLAPNSIAIASEVLNQNEDVSMVFGSCDYMDERSRVFGTNRSGQWAVGLMRMGPCLVPQPGALFRRDVFEVLGGLDVSFNWAFDYEFFLRMSKNYKIRYIPETLASFRWHNDSLSVVGRKSSVAEASRVRKMHLSKVIRPISNIWELPVKIATERAGYFVNRSANKLEIKAVKDDL